MIVEQLTKVLKYAIVDKRNDCNDSLDSDNYFISKEERVIRKVIKKLCMKLSAEIRIYVSNSIG